MNDLLDFEVKERMENERKLKSHIRSLGRSFIWTGLILIIGVQLMIGEITKQADEIKQLQEQVRANRESVLHNAEVDKRQEVILSKLNQEYQMKRYQKEGKK